MVNALVLVIVSDDEKLFSLFSLDLVIKVKSFQGDAISFSMPRSDVFMIVEKASRPYEARLRTNSKLDYETDRHTYSLVITALERGTGLSSSVQVCGLPKFIL